MRDDNPETSPTGFEGGASRLFNERGSALILVILLTLVLSASAIVAMRDVARSVHQSAVFRTRHQAQLMSDASMMLWAKRAGDKADEVMHAVKEGAYGAGTTGSTTGLYGAGMEDSSGASYADLAYSKSVEGGYIKIGPGDDGVSTFLGGSTSGTTGYGESGLFVPDDSASFSDVRSFETRRGATWEVIFRDPYDGIPAPGFSDQYCFPKMLVASNARVGQPDPSWQQANNIATARHGLDTLLGPIECGYSN